MRRLAIIPVLAASVLLGAAAPAPAPAPAAAPLLSYRAQYEVVMAPGTESRNLAGVRGLMVIEFREACGVYSETQRFVLDMTDVDENTARADSSSTVRESADGRRFEFTVTDSVVGKGAMRLVGSAMLSAVGEGKAVFTMPSPAELVLPKGTVFPTQFTKRILAAARAGNPSVSATIFQGDDPKRLTTASAFIGAEVTGADEEVTGNAAMAGMRSWPMVVSYYPSDSEGDTPEFEMTFRGYENGVATGVRMKYPDFVLVGHLVKLEELPAACTRQ